MLIMTQGTSSSHRTLRGRCCVVCGASLFKEYYLLFIMIIIMPYSLISFPQLLGSLIIFFFSSSSYLSSYPSTPNPTFNLASLFLSGTQQASGLVGGLGQTIIGAKQALSSVVPAAAAGGVQAARQGGRLLTFIIIIFSYL